MAEDALGKETTKDVQWYEDIIPVRGCQLTLPQIKTAYRELEILTKQQGEKIVGSLQKPDDIDDEKFKEQNAFLRIEAFKLTVSIIGFEGDTTYGETADVFDSKNLPSPIKTIYFTNKTSFKRHANGSEPSNRFSVYIHFDKPPLFDATSILSESTTNLSQVEINADDVTYIRAVQTIINNKLKSNKKWFRFIHGKFAYDIGLWFCAFPMALYWVTIYCDYFLPTNGSYPSFRVAFFIYGLGMSLLFYRALFGYVKWALPVNILEENKDNATAHRVVLSGIVLSLFVSALKSLLGI